MPHSDDEFEKKVRKIDRATVGLLVNVYVSIITTLIILKGLGVF